MPRLPLMGRFTTTTIVVVVLVGALFALESEHEVHERELRAAQESAELLVGLGLLPRLDEADFRPGPTTAGDPGGPLDRTPTEAPTSAPEPTTPATPDPVDDDVAEVVADRDEVVTLVAADGTPVATTGSVDLVLPTVMLQPPSAREPELEVTIDAAGDSWMHVQVPVRLDADRVVGAVVVSSPLAPVLATVRAQVIREVLLLGLAVTVLATVLYRSVAGVSRRLHEQARERDHAAAHDDLTGLPNRVLLAERTTEALRRQSRTGQRTALLLLDLDRFKEINDVLGHPAGDELLRKVARRLRDEIHPTDTLARLGGDEFAVLLPAVTDLAAAAGVAGRLVRALDEPFQLGSVEVSVGASVGISCAPGDADNSTDLLAHADAAMYVAKRSRLEVATYQLDVEDEADIDRLRLLGGLRRAIEEEQLVLHYQPQVALTSGEVVGVEALVRWQHPTRGLLAPGAFIPLAEQSGLMGPLTSWVLETALAQLAAWREQGIDVAMAINVPPRTLAESGFAGRIFTSLARWGIEPRNLELEITEDSIVVEGRQVTVSLDRLRRLGVRIAIDDFGTGYSSLSYLTALPVDVLKIDRTLVRSLVEHDGQTTVLEAVARLGHDLGLVIVAEGVEDDMSLSALRTLGVDLAQGYGLGRPAPADEVVDLLRPRRSEDDRGAGADRGEGDDRGEGADAGRGAVRASQPPPPPPPARHRRARTTSG